MSSTKLRVSFTISSLNPGGAEKVVAVLAEGLAAQGLEVSIITLQGRCANDLPVPNGVSLVALSCHGDSPGIVQKIWSNITRIRRMRRAIRHCAPDVVASFGDRTNALVLLATVGLPIAIAVSERIHPMGGTTPWPWRLLRRLTYPHASCLVVQAQSIGDAFWGMPRLRREVIGNPVPLSNFSRAPRHVAVHATFELIAIGRLVHQKGFDILIDAFAEVVAVAPQARLRIYGAGPERAALEQRVCALALEASVSFKGRTHDVAAVLAGADLFVLSSRFEGMPNVMLEAMARGVPTVATNCPGAVWDVAGAGRYAYLVDVGDTAGLGAIILRFIRDPALRVDYAQRAVCGARRFAEPTVLARWYALISELAASARQQA